jgi:hypothetical protein
MPVIAVLKTSEQTRAILARSWVEEGSGGEGWSSVRDECEVTFMHPLLIRFSGGLQRVTQHGALPVRNSAGPGSF